MNSKVDIPTVEVLGVHFFNGTLNQALEAALSGGLVVAPSAPGLTEDFANPNYARAIRSADLALADSGITVLLCRILRGLKIHRISGLRFVRALVDMYPERCSENCLWVMPGEKDSQALSLFMAAQGHAMPPDSYYHAPMYDRMNPTDPNLVRLIEARRPAMVVLAISGGKQEPLGYWLRGQLSYRPTILCIGAAIAFVTGTQANIPPWADRLYLGWIIRFFREPRRYWKRYLKTMILPVKLIQDRFN